MFDGAYSDVNSKVMAVRGAWLLSTDPVPVGQAVKGAIREKMVGSGSRC